MTLSRQYYIGSMQDVDTTVRDLLATASDDEIEGRLNALIARGDMKELDAWFRALGELTTLTERS